jgi:hypothetical protein
VDFICPYCACTISPADPYVQTHGRCTQCGGAITLPPNLVKTPSALPSSGVPVDGSLPFAPEAEQDPAVQAEVLADLGVADPMENPVGTHYVLQELITDYVEQVRTDPRAVLLAIEACRQQIAMAPAVVMALHRSHPAAALPRHAGFEALCLLRERQGQYEDVVLLAEEALAQGWAGPWERLIIRCKKTTIQRKKPVE